jgi:hypothetical protein
MTKRTPHESNVFEERADADLFGTIRRFLEEQGVDVDREIEHARSAEQHRVSAVKAEAEELVSLGRAILRAKRQVEVDEAMWRLNGRRRDQWLNDLTASMRHVDDLKDALREACANDSELYDDVMRSARRGVR